VRFYVSFGGKYAQEAHPVFVNGVWADGRSDPRANEMRYAHPDNWIEVEAPDESAARQIVVDHIGSYWSMMYNEAEWDAHSWTDRQRWFPGRCILELWADGRIEVP